MRVRKDADGKECGDDFVATYSLNAVRSRRRQLAGWNGLPSRSTSMSTLAPLNDRLVDVALGAVRLLLAELRSRRSGPGAQSGDLATWKTGVLATAASAQRRARFSGCQDSRTPRPPRQFGRRRPLRRGGPLTAFAFPRRVRSRGRSGSAPVRRAPGQAVDAVRPNERQRAVLTPEVRRRLGRRGSVGRPRERPLEIFVLLSPDRVLPCPVNPQVPGSSPGRGAIRIERLRRRPEAALPSPTTIR